MTASHTIDKPDINPDITEAGAISEHERQLTEQLAAILNHPPSKRKQQRKAAQEKVSSDVFTRTTSDPKAGNDEFLPPPIPTSQTLAEAGNELARDNKTPAPADTPRPITSSDAHPDFENATIVKTTRRARLRHGVKQAGSWLITLAVIGFITACVALILLGLPKVFDPTTRVSATSVQPINAIKGKTTVLPGTLPASPRQ